MIRLRYFTAFATVATALLSLTWLGCKDDTTDPDNNPVDTCEYFTYSGPEGPDHWKDLCPAYAACGGSAQSPINIAGATTDLTLGPITFAYDSSATAIINTGHSIQWNENGGNSITYRGTTYTLKQFHLHTPAEHTVSGITYPMELHIVHEDAAGKLAVIGILFRAGAENPFLAQFMSNLPTTSGGRYDNAMKYLIEDVLPARTEYFTYSGSLTTPPCSEIVTWLVLQSPVFASQAQLDALAAIMGANNRPLQQLNGRAIKSF